MRAAILLPIASLIVTIFASPVAVGCNPTEATHVFVLDGAMATLDDDGAGWGRPTARPLVADDCTVASGGNIPGDGDPNVGLGGGVFPALQACLDANHVPRTPPAVAHHAAFDGAKFAAQADPGWETIWLVATAGTDGEVLAGTCVGDGIIDDVSPYDCGSSEVGWGLGYAEAVVRSNPALRDPITDGVIVSADCTRPADGTVWVMVSAAGASVTGALASTPVDWCIEEILAGDPIGVPNVPGCVNLAGLPTLNPQSWPHVTAIASFPVTGTIYQVV